MEPQVHGWGETNKKNNEGAQKGALFSSLAKPRKVSSLFAGRRYGR